MSVPVLVIRGMYRLHSGENMMLDSVLAGKVLLRVPGKDNGRVGDVSELAELVQMPCPVCGLSYTVVAEHGVTQIDLVEHMWRSHLQGGV